MNEIRDIFRRFLDDLPERGVIHIEGPEASGKTLFTTLAAAKRAVQKKSVVLVVTPHRMVWQDTLAQVAFRGEPVSIAVMRGHIKFESGGEIFLLKPTPEGVIGFFAETLTVIVEDVPQISKDTLSALQAYLPHENCLFIFTGDGKDERYREIQKTWQGEVLKTSIHLI